jgi:hypothetical protein
MIAYKLIKPSFGSVNIVERLSDNAFIPFDPQNTDFANFKKEVLAGAELQDADGNVMSQEQATEFINTLQ